MDQNYIQQLTRYEDGYLYWNVSKQGRKMDKPLGSHPSGTYPVIEIDGNRYQLHHLIFLFHNGYLPEYIDHIDGNKRNNRIENLRECSIQQNNYNRRLEVTSTSGIKGVCWYKSRQKWRVQVGVNGKRKTVGCFDDIELAELVAIEYRNKHHGEFARHL